MTDAPPSPRLIAAPRVFDGTAMRGPAVLTIAAGRIEAIAQGAAPAADALVLPENAILAPGFIDVQVNGGGGVLLNDEPTVTGVSRIVAAHRAGGTTGCLPTLITDRAEMLEQLSQAAAAALGVAGVLGFHLEGPAINRARKGIHLESEIRIPTGHDVTLFKRFGEFGRSMITLAPEIVPPGLIRELAHAGLRVAVGHSEATALQVTDAAGAGATGVTHLYNAMSQLSGRAPGVVGAALADERLFAGLICDGLHVDPVALRVAMQSKGRDRLMLVTDAMPLVGTALREFTLQGRRITLDDNRLTGADGTLAGAHLTMIEAVRNATSLMQVELADALIMASRTPASFLGLDTELGRIAPGYRADLVAFTHNFEVLETWVAGRPSAAS